MQKNWIQSIIRPQIKDFEPYLPGRSMECVRRERGLKRIMKLASNENPLGASPKALAAIRKAAKNLFLYPDGASVSLRAAVARKAGVEPDRVIIGAGSDELIELMGKAFLNPGDSIVVSEHAFIRYRMAGELMGAEVLTVPMRHYTHDLSAMLQAVRENTKIVFIANPNNPTGTYNTQAELGEFLKELKSICERRHPSSAPSPLAEGRGTGEARGEGSRVDCPLVVVDEAYYEYAKALAPDYPDTLGLQKRYSNLVTLRTFSKAHALAGLRVGYSFADPRIIEALDRVRPPFNISVLGQAGAEASLKDEAHLRQAVRLVLAERKKVLPALSKRGVPVIPSIGNFILLDLSPRKGAEVFESLLDRGIIVRSLDEYGFPNHIRVTYGLPKENQAFLHALREVLGR
jgi:histidinol-phosphate aminotransferase